MSSLKSLCKDTAIYGLSSIVGRFLNYLLVPLYTAKISAESGGYGVITNVYAYTALLIVMLTYGMETSYFRFANKEGLDSHRVYSTVLTMVGSTSVAFFVLVLIFLKPISCMMGYADHPDYIWTMALVVAMDAFQCIPFAYLRQQKRPIKFATLKMTFIVINIVVNLLAFVVMPLFTGKATDVGYAFYINLACTSIIMLLFRQELCDAFSGSIIFDKSLCREMLKYGWPILVLGLAGILNQTADKILFPFLYDGENAHAQLGIYGATSKIAMIMAMITQAFRYAYEPYVFGSAKDKNSNESYAKAMKFFIVFTLLAFIMVMAYINLLKYIIAEDYWEGLRVVPIVMAAEIMMGVYFNLSFWYKLIDKTIWGAFFSGIGCAVLIAMNVAFVPKYGYMACAWAGVAGYGVSMVLSYVVGQKKNPINYPLGSIAIYVAMTVLFFCIISWSNSHFSLLPALCINTMVVLAFVSHVGYHEFLKKRKNITDKSI